jgi:beta-lactamase regulating signal transducer with metallopeptidase domain
MTELLSRLGAGLLLSWWVLPLSLLLAKRSRDDAPASYYRALVAALCVSAAMLAVPALAAWMRTEHWFLKVRSTVPSFEALRAARSTLAEVADLGPSSGFSVLAVLGGAWLLVFGLALTRGVAGRVRLRRLCAAAQPGSEAVQRATDVIAAQLGLPAPRILVSEAASVPFAAWPLSPVIVLPRALSESWSESELELALRHELAHIGRGDLELAAVVAALRQLFAGHPSLPGLLRELALAREASVDARVAAPEPARYARFLVDLGSRVRFGESPALTGLSMAGSVLERRVEMILNRPLSSCRPVRSTPVLLAFSGLALAAAVVVAPLSWAEGKENGRLPEERIQEVVRAAYPRFGECYDALPEPRRSVRIELHFTIGSDGRVSDGHVDAEQEPKLGKCAEPVLKRLQFPKPDGGIVTVVYPIDFSPE